MGLNYSLGLVGFCVPRFELRVTHLGADPGGFDSSLLEALGHHAAAEPPKEGEPERSELACH